MQRNYGVKDYQPMLDLAECKYEVTSGYKLCPTKKKEKKKKQNQFWQLEFLRNKVKNTFKSFLFNSGKF